MVYVNCCQIERCPTSLVHLENTRDVSDDNSFLLPTSDNIIYVRFQNLILWFKPGWNRGTILVTYSYYANFQKQKSVFPKYISLGLFKYFRSHCHILQTTSQRRTMTTPLATNNETNVTQLLSLSPVPIFIDRSIYLVTADLFPPRMILVLW